MKNPVVAAREAKGLTRTQAAIQMGVNYFSLTRLEKGLVASVSPAWKPRFALMGWDYSSMRDEYATWHDAQKGHKEAAHG